jgi:phosphatidylcholine synthase
VIKGGARHRFPSALGTINPVISFPVVRAWGVHLYTALGLICALMALIGIFEDNARMMWTWLGIALIIDSTDGMMARKFEVKRWVPRFDGAKLDDITDYINYAFVPIIALYRFGLVGLPMAWVLGIVLIAAAYGFNMDVAKTDDGFFTGFPNYWNVVVFYLMLFRSPEPVTIAILLLCAAAIFWPVKYLYPSKTKFLKPLNILTTSLFIVLSIAIVVNWGNVPGWLMWLSLIVGPGYYLAVSFMLHFFPALDRTRVSING